MDYLEAKGFEFQYIYLDRIDFELKREVKKELRKKYESLPVFPILTVNEATAVSGFTEPTWDSLLGAE